MGQNFATLTVHFSRDPAIPLPSRYHREARTGDTRGRTPGSITGGNEEVETTTGSVPWELISKREGIPPWCPRSSKSVSLDNMERA